MNFSSTGALWAQLTLIGLLVGGIMTAVWTVVTVRASGGLGQTGYRPAWLLLALGAGALAFAPSIIDLQIPLQSAASRWMASAVASASPLILSLPAVALSGIVQEVVKFVLAAVLLVVAVGSIRFRGTGPALMGAVMGAGYGGFEAWAVMSVVLAYPGVTAANIAVAGLERVAAVALHIALSGIPFLWWARRGPLAGLLALAAMALYHGLVNYGAAVYQAGLMGTLMVEIYIIVLSLALLMHFTSRLRRERRGEV